MNRPSIHSCASLVTALGLLSSPAQAAVIDFAGTHPVALVGQPFAVAVEITYEAGETTSLFSYGVSVLPAASAIGISTFSIDVPAPLEFNGTLGPGAFRAIQSDFAGVKGTVDLLPVPIEPYPGKLLATFNLRFDLPGSYPLRLDIFNTLGPTEDIFVAGDGAVLDDQITFGSTVISVVIPETQCAALLSSGLVCMALRRRRGHQ
ncbi:MAG: hypothetical protein ACKV19_11510 [Verrucomicrobiales bacterium]